MLKLVRSLLALPAALGLSACFLFEPAEQIQVALPLEGTIARIEVWGNTLHSEGRFELIVQSPAGEVGDILWEDWEPAQRASLYLTPQEWLVVLGGGRLATMVELSPEGPPRIVPPAERPREGSELWTYLGAVDRVIEKGEASLAFFGPSEQRECVPLYGGSSPYRVAHQDPGFC